MADNKRETLHATSLALGEFGLLIRGASGAGKSDLALRMLSLNEPDRFRLVSDDRTIVEKDGMNLVISAPPSILGHLEVRGIGIVQFPVQANANLVLAVELTSEPIERLPEFPATRASILGTCVDQVSLNPFEASAPLKVSVAMRQAIARAQTHTSSGSTNSRPSGPY